MVSHLLQRSVIYIYIYIYIFVVNRQRHHNIRNGILWVQTGHSTCTFTATWCVIELWTHQQFESFRLNNSENPEIVRICFPGGMVYSPTFFLVSLSSCLSLSLLSHQPTTLEHRHERRPRAAHTWHISHDKHPQDTHATCTNSLRIITVMWAKPITCMNCFGNELFH